MKTYPLDAYNEHFALKPSLWTIGLLVLQTKILPISAIAYYLQDKNIVLIDDFYATNTLYLS